MTRRAFFTQITVIATQSAVVSTSGYHGHVDSPGQDSGHVGFEISGHFDSAGADNSLAYYSLGQGISLMLDPARVPSCVEGADALVKGQARIILMRA